MMKQPYRASTFQLQGYITINDEERHVRVRVHVVRILPNHYQIVQAFFYDKKGRWASQWKRLIRGNEASFLSRVLNPKFGGRSALGVIDLKVKSLIFKQRTLVPYKGTPNIIKGRESSEF